jgi:hypothetical protein
MLLPCKNYTYVICVHVRAFHIADKWNKSNVAGLGSPHSGQ